MAALFVNFVLLQTSVALAILSFLNIRFLYWKWVDHHTFAQPVLNTSQENIVQEDTIKIYMTAMRI